MRACSTRRRCETCCSPSQPWTPSRSYGANGSWRRSSATFWQTTRTSTPSGFGGTPSAPCGSAFPDATAEPLAEDELDATDIDPGDRHVVAAAVAAGADAIVTINVRHFPVAALNPVGIAVLTPGFLLDMLETLQPSLVDQALDAMSRRWKNPPRTSREILNLLMVHPTMAEPVALIKQRRSPAR